MQGNGQLDVVEGTDAGTIYVLNGTNGSVVWSASTSGAILGSPVTADLTGDGYQDVLVPSTNGIEIFDGKSGAARDHAGRRLKLQNAPLVTDDANGQIGITAAAGSEVTHWEIGGTNASGSNVNESGAWPQFHHDPQLRVTPGRRDRTSRCRATHRRADRTATS